MKFGNSRKLVVAITGASGSVYARQLLQKLHHIQNQWEELAVVMTDNAREVWKTELHDSSYSEYDPYLFSNKDFGASFASGSGNFGTMIIIPCSIGTLGRIASGTSADLITRAADVILKERRKLILVTRDTPLSLIHINNMKTITEAGGIILPASPSFYSKPKTMEIGRAHV